MQSTKDKLAEIESQLTAVKFERDNLQRELNMTKGSNKTSEMESDSITNEKLQQELSTAQRELQHVRLSMKYEEEDHRLHTDRIHTLEDLTKQLELDNRELAAKVN